MDCFPIAGEFSRRSCFASRPIVALSCLSKVPANTPRRFLRGLLSYLQMLLLYQLAACFQGSSKHAPSISVSIESKHFQDLCGIFGIFFLLGHATSQVQCWGPYEVNGLRARLEVLGPARSIFICTAQTSCFPGRPFLRIPFSHGSLYFPCWF